MSPSPDRIPTTHAGSLPRPADLLDMLVAKDEGAAVDARALRARTREAVAEVVARQVACGIDTVSDGEFSKISYINYLKHRLDGFGDPAPLDWTPQDMADHPDYAASLRGADEKPRVDPPACRGPLSVRDSEPLEADLATFRAAVDAAEASAGFMNAPSPGVVALFMPNRFYPSEEAYIGALAEVLAEEYRAIHQAGFTLQIDCPDLAMARHMAFAGRPLEDFRKAARISVEAINAASDGIPATDMRMHVCWGNYPGPHTHDVPFKDIADIVFEARPHAVLFEGANPRHAHEWEELREVDIPEDKVLVPGVIDTNTNTVEHPKVVAQRIARYADLVGRERVMAGTDCGFATLASLPRVWPSIVWEKLRVLVEGAAIATDRLWGR